MKNLYIHIIFDDHSLQICLELDAFIFSLKFSYCGDTDNFYTVISDNV